MTVSVCVFVSAEHLFCFFVFLLVVVKEDFNFQAEAPHLHVGNN